MMVVWNGSIDRAAAELERRRPTKTNERVFVASLTVKIVEVLRGRDDATMPELGACFPGVRQNAVNNACYRLITSGEIVKATRVVRTSRGRTSMSYRIATRCATTTPASPHPMPVNKPTQNQTPQR
jgi:hypothetical protein